MSASSKKSTQIQNGVSSARPFEVIFLGTATNNTTSYEEKQEQYSIENEKNRFQ